MPRLKNLPSLDVIHGYRGVLDFYLWRGLACVRKWPVNPKSHHSEATKAAAATFGDVSKAWSLIGGEILAAYQENAKDQPRSSRDVFFAAVYGHLHEVAMPDYTALLTACRDSLALIDNLVGALESVDTDDLLVKVTASVLPAGAATEDKQDDIIAALDSRAPSVAIYNLSLSDANTEYSQALMPNTRKFLIKCRGSQDLKLAFTQNMSGTTFLTIPANTAYYEDFITPTTLTLYIQCPVPSQFAEIVNWAQE